MSDTHNITPTAPITHHQLSPTKIFDLLRDDRRRYILHYLFRHPGVVSLNDLADQITRWEEKLSYDCYERILTSLYHIHFPKLANAGLIQYDTEQETVELLETADQVSPYLALAAAEDIQ